jgi:hypothetical protein
MKTFKKPENLNGAELKNQLKSVGIIIEDVIDFADGTIGFDTTDEKKAAEIVKAHNGTTIAPEPTISDKLASVGLSLNDLKIALGI